MNRSLYFAAFLAGLACLTWVGAGYLPSHPWALAMTALIAAVYLAGAFELQRLRRSGSTLARALAQLNEPPAALDRWLDTIDPALHHAVRLRIDGQRVALPGPALTPYLAGLLVLLGMLGTFLGMVATLKGTALALDGATSVEAMRTVLSAPVKGLGFAFGTSVAGVAASAMLGLMSALCRRERLQATQQLDAKVATVLFPYSRAHQRDESFRLLQRQAETMPALVDALQAMMAALQRQSQEQAARLATSQEDFHRRTESAYTALAASVERSLKDSLAETARAAGATVPPMIEAAMAGIASQTNALHESVSQTVARQLDGLSTRFEAGAAAMAETFDRRSAAWLESVGAAQRAAQAEAAEREQQRLAQWASSLQAMATSLQHEWQQAGAHTLGQQQQICRTLEDTARDMTARAQAHARDTIAEIARLVQAASEAPRAAAEVIGELRQHLSEAMQRDNALLDERNRLLSTLDTLLGTLNHAATEQRAAIDALVASSAAQLEGAGARLAGTLEASADKVAATAAQVTAGAAEVASLGEAFGFAVRLFSESSDKLMAQLGGIEGALGQTLARSDEQLAYYVAQARELIELTIVSQKQIIDDLQRVSMQHAPATAEA